MYSFARKSMVLTALVCAGVSAVFAGKRRDVEVFDPHSGGVGSTASRDVATVREGETSVALASMQVIELARRGDIKRGFVVENSPSMMESEDPIFDETAFLLDLPSTVSVTKRKSQCTVQ